MRSYKAVQSTQGMGTYDLAIHAIIRPPKATYRPQRLGARRFTNKVGTLIRRVDQEMVHDGQVFGVSTWIPTYDGMPNYMPPNLILYCHCNSSNRLECKSLVDDIPYNYAVAGFDFLGCGNSNNMYISLGVREKEQVRTLMNVMRHRFQRVILWGRSMGAVSVLLFHDAPIMVVDSPFTTVKQIGKDQTPNKCCRGCLFCCLFPCAWQCVKNSVKKRAQYNLNDINTVEAVRTMSPQQAIVFIAGKEDTLVKPTHSKKLYDNFPGRKSFLLVEGTHNSRRSKQTFDETLSILDRYIAENANYQQMLLTSFQQPYTMGAVVNTETRILPSY